jgi:hypothetical protein
MKSSNDEKSQQSFAISMQVPGFVICFIHVQHKTNRKQAGQCCITLRINQEESGLVKDPVERGPVGCWFRAKIPKHIGKQYTANCNTPEDIEVLDALVELYRG